MRANEPKPPPQKNAALQAYLKKYTDGASGGEEAKRKKKKKVKPTGGAVQILDNDISGFVATRSPIRAARGVAAEAEEEDGE